MAFHEVYRRQVGLLVRVLPIVADEADFALKGGTAINLFVRDMPRLSVDIDLAYLPIAPRDESLKAIDTAIKRLARNIEQGIKGARVTFGPLEDGATTKLFVRADRVQVKIEVTPVLRGTVFAPYVASVVPAVEETFGFAEAQLVSLPDLYAGKLVAGLDRQHPRDLFDIRNLLAAEGVDDELRKAFVIYILSHHRPMAELLAPARRDISERYEREFQGMTAEPVPIEELNETREALVDVMVGQMPRPHREFLLQFKRGDPDWSLLGSADVANLPAVKWKQINLGKLSADDREAWVRRLEGILDQGGN